MGASFSRPSRWAARRGTLLVFALTTLLLLVGSTVEAQGLIATALDRQQATEAGREAQLVADVALAAALSSGRLASHALRPAAAEYAEAREQLPLTGLILWSHSGRVLLARGSGQAAARQPRLPPVAQAALTTGSVRTAYTTLAGVGATVQAAVPLGPRGWGAVVDFDFSRRGVEHAAAAAAKRMYLFTGIAALIIYLLVLPLLARLAGRVRLPIDAFHRAATADLKRGLAHRELVVHYQPKIDIEDGSVVGVEALVRWDHPRRGLLGPAEFLEYAVGDPGLLAAFTAQVLARAMADCVGWREAGAELPVAVNLATEVLSEPLLMDLVRDALEAHGLDPRFITLELTEDALMEHGLEVTAPLTRLRQLGVSLSIDDFGTGHSSLARLRSLPLDELKVDRSLISRIATDARDLRIATHIIALGLDLGLRVVAEGIEDEATLRTLSAVGCPIAQGYHISRPMAEPDLRKWLEGRTLAPPPAPASASTPPPRAGSAAAGADGRRPSPCRLES